MSRFNKLLNVKPTNNNDILQRPLSFSPQDQNDFTPKFERQAYTAPNLLETVSPGTQIVQVKAADEDPEGKNSDIRYSIQTVNPASGQNFFYIYPETGSVTLSRPINTDKETSRYVVSMGIVDMIWDRPSSCQRRQ